MDGHPNPRSIAVARVLGVRLGIQALVDVASWPEGRGAGTVIDSLHAMSGLVFAGVGRRWRRTALIDAAIASSFTLWGYSLRSRTSYSRAIESS